MRYSLNFGMFTDCGNSIYNSYPYSFDMPERRAIAGSFVLDLSMLKFYVGKQYSVLETDDLVNIVSSRNIILKPSFLNFRICLNNFYFSLNISSADLFG